MKKFLLLTLASCMGLASYGADAKWTASVNGIFDNDEAIYSGNVVAMDALGNTYVAGQYNKDEVTINNTKYEGIGKSAYIVKYDANGVAQWSVNLKGAATITAIACDNNNSEPYIYVAGTFADEVVLGNNQGSQPQTIKGAKNAYDDSYVADQISSFIVKYRATDGCLSTTTTFIPEEIAEALNLGGDAFFEISDIYVYDSTVYCAARYGGITKHGTAEFNGYSVYNPEWFCRLYCKSASVFTLSLGLAECNNKISCGPGKDLGENDVVSNATGVRMLVDGSTVYAAFSASGPVSVKEENFEAKDVDCEADADSYIFRCLGGNTSTYAAIVNEDIDETQPFAPAAMAIDGDKLLCLTYQTIDTGEGKERQTSVYTLKTTEFTSNSKEVSKAYAEGDVDYSVISKAAYTNNNWVCALRGRDKGGETVAFKAGALNGSTFTAAPAADAVTFAANDKVAVYAIVSGQGVEYAQYENAFSGIYDIIADDENAPVEYFNIQGVRVDNPDNGIYIRRQGSKVSKVLVK